MSSLSIRPIESRDNKEIAEVIRKVMPQFGATGPGFAINDPEVDQMFEAYQIQGHRYFVVTDGVTVFGGAGIAPLSGAGGETCELRKMYIVQQIRGQGVGQKLMDQCLQSARHFGYKECYLETLKAMADAQRLYLKNGFVPLPAPKGETGHFSCDSYYLKIL